MSVKGELTRARQANQADTSATHACVEPRAARIILIQPPRQWEALGLRELWHYHELIYFLTWRDLKVRYKQTLIGAAWAVLQPFLTMVVFSLIFGGVLRVPSDGVPYPLFVYTALLPWSFFSAALTRASNSLIYDANLISKIYFPRLIIPLAAMLSFVVDFAIAFAILLGMMLFYRVEPGVATFAFPLYLLLAFTTALAAGLWLAALNVKYRDVAYAVPFLIQFWLFASPVAYPSSLIPQAWSAIYALNPMVSVIDGFRWALLGTEPLPTPWIAISTAVVLALLCGGVLYFRRVEGQFADIV